jgi:hypothetical protein
LPKTRASRLARVNVCGPEIRPRRTRSACFELDRCYWSVQRPDLGTTLGFAARTLFWDRHSRQARMMDFPVEPVMDWLVTADGPLCCHGDQAIGVPPPWRRPNGDVGRSVARSSRPYRMLLGRVGRGE